jgi:hypothetical protein
MHRVRPLSQQLDGNTRQREGSTVGERHLTVLIQLPWPEVSNGLGASSAIAVPSLPNVGSAGKIAPASSLYTLSQRVASTRRLRDVNHNTFKIRI